MARPKSSKPTERQTNYEPTSFHFKKVLKKKVARYVFDQKQDDNKMSQEIFINAAVEHYCKHLKI